jgi:hypothetical protein
MDTGHTDSPDAAIRLLWPELAPEPLDRLDNESAAIAERRAKVFRAYCQGKTIRQVAEECGIISKSQVARDVHHVLDGYRLIALQDAAAHIASELAKLARIEAEAWAAWDRSQKTSHEEEREPSILTGKMSVSKIKNRRRDGTAEWLRIALDCHDRRCRLLKLHTAESGGESDVADYLGKVLARRAKAAESN